jgi:hypothetical protein
MTPLIFRLRAPEYEFEARDDVMRVDFPMLRAQTNYTFLIHMDE